MKIASLKIFSIPWSSLRMTEFLFWFLFIACFVGQSLCPMKDSIKIAATVGASVLANFQSREVQMALGNRSDIDVDVQACFHRLLRGELLSEPTVEEIESLLADHFLWNMEMVRDSGIKAGRRWRYREGVSGPLNRHASAEIQSTLEMLDREAFQGCSIQLYLLCTDTQISQLAARVIARAMKQEGQRRGLVWQAEVRVISGLQVLDKKKFEDEGFDELFRNIRAIQAAEPPEAPICLNVTGGYKSILPILTVIGQLFDYPLYYVFQFSGAGHRQGRPPGNPAFAPAVRLGPHRSLAKLLDETGYSPNLPH